MQINQKKLNELSSCVHYQYPKKFVFKIIHSALKLKSPCKHCVSKGFKFDWWPCQESNLDLELRKLLYYPLYDKARKNNY